MRTITIPKPANDSLVAQLGSLYEVFKGVKFGEKLSFDLCQLNWACPLLVLPISAYVKETESKIGMDECEIKGYLDKMNFPKGVNSISAFQQQVQKHKTFIPISVLSKEEKVGREKLISLFEEKIDETLGKVSGARSAVLYPISELITNIFEHSKKDFGYAFGQFYPNKGYLDICIVDCGRGFAKNYKEEKGLDFTDEEAITESIRGTSAKKEKERGYGLRTSKDIICKALNGGGFILISGSGVLISNKQGDNLGSLTDFYWQGAIIAFRIPKPTGAIDYLRYVE
ncbi:MAG: hypothetical protein ABII07_02905 [Patescibacteria group bacterium]